MRKGALRLLKYIGALLGILVGIVIGINLTIHLLTFPYEYNTIRSAPHAEVALVLGAALSTPERPAPIFMDRANTAIALYRAGKVSKILVSGDGDAAHHDEVDPMHAYLLSQGIPNRVILLDHAGLTTYDSMYRAQALFGITSMLIASQSFHLPRAVFIARALGINAYGVNADRGHILLFNYVREIFADEKAVYDVLLHVHPPALSPTSSSPVT